MAIWRQQIYYRIVGYILGSDFLWLRPRGQLVATIFQHHRVCNDAAYN